VHLPYANHKLKNTNPNLTYNQKHQIKQLHITTFSLQIKLTSRKNLQNEMITDAMRWNVLLAFALQWSGVEIV